MMSERLLCSLLVVLLSWSLPALPAFAAGQKKPTRGAVRKAFEAAAPSLVEVIGPKRRGPGIIVGADGHVLTSVMFVGLEEAQVQLGPRTLPAKVVLADARSKIAIVQVENDEPLRSVAVRLNEPFRRGTHLIGVTRGRLEKARPRVARVAKAPKDDAPFVEIDFPLPVGTPIVDPQGRLVAITVAPSPSGALALPLSLVKLQLRAAEELEQRVATP